MNHKLTRHALAVPLLSVAITLLLTLTAAAQVRQAPAGNELPHDDAHADAHILEDLGAHAHEGHDHAHDHDHEQEGHAHGAPASDMSRQQHDAFAEAVDLSDFRKLAVFDDGRVKILETLASEQINRIYGKTRWKDLVSEVSYDPVFTYLDLLFNKPYYFDKPMVYVEILPLRRELLMDLPADEQEVWLKRGRLTPLMLVQPHAQQILSGQNEDLRLMKAQNAVMNAALNFDRIGERMMMVSPASGSDKWMHLAQIAEGTPTGIADADLAKQVADEFKTLATAWRAGDAVKTNASLAVLVDLIPQLNPATYPSEGRRNLEAIYNATHRFTIGYFAYLVGALLLLLAFAVGRRSLIAAGAGFLLTGFAVHTAGMLVRSALSGRWPIHNQFESFVAITWFAVLVGLILMFARKQWLFGAAAAALGAAALFVANTMDIPSNEVGQVAGILATSRILYIHVNIVLCSYALIGLGFFISLFYLAVHHLRGKHAVQVAAAGLGAINEEDNTPTRGRAALLHDLDKAQMIVLQLAFWLLGFGILLGAYWADHSWGRWWAWDPKETWALITWIIYLIAIHVRFTVKNRGLVTAWLSVIGFIMMLWTYWGVNMLLAGLHSYA